MRFLLRLVTQKLVQRVVRRQVILVIGMALTIAWFTESLGLFQSEPRLALPPGLATVLPILSLGKVMIHSGPIPCDGQECYELEVSCSQLSRPEVVEIKVGAPINSAVEQGTILFAAGWIGSYWWAQSDGVHLKGQVNTQFAQAPSPSSGLPTLFNNRMIIDAVRTQGFKTVQIKWTRGWFIAEYGQREDFSRLACKPATVVRWVYDNLHRQDPDKAYCAAGHSNGASQLAYAMAQYGLASIFDLLVFEGGPNWSRVDYSCLNDPSNSQMHGDDGVRDTIDWAFGYKNDGRGICARENAFLINRFRQSSLVLGDLQYFYSHTRIAFIIGEDDQTSTAAHGRYFYDALRQSGSPLVDLQTVPGAGHFVTEAPVGAEVMKHTLLNECHVR